MQSCLTHDWQAVHEYEACDEYSATFANCAESGWCVHRHRRTIDFAYDPDKDTPEEIADEITNEFELSSTDRDICAAALKVSPAAKLLQNLIRP